MKKKLVILFTCIILLSIWIFYWNRFKLKVDLINWWIEVLCNSRYDTQEDQKSCYDKNKYFEKKENLWTIWTAVRWCFNDIAKNDKSIFINFSHSKLNADLDTYSQCIQMFAYAASLQKQSEDNWQIEEPTEPKVEEPIIDEPEVIEEPENEEPEVIDEEVNTEKDKEVVKDVLDIIDWIE